MENRLKILFVEDVLSDYELAVREIRQSGTDIETMRVDEPVAFRKALGKFQPDVVISDYAMPRFNGLDALKITRESDPHMPFIVLTGSMNEETAVVCMKAGATDYVLKEHCARLPFSVQEALEKRKIAGEKEQALQRLRESEEKYKSLFSNSHAVMMLVDPEDGGIVDVNPAACNFYGWTHKELTSKKISEINTLTAEEIEKEIKDAVAEKRNHFHFRHRKASGEIRDVEVYTGPITVEERILLYSIVHDITERRELGKALQESEKRYREMFVSNPLPMLIYEAESFRIIEVNDAAVSKYEYTREEFTKMTLEDLHPEEDIPALLAAAQESSEGFRYSRAWRHRRKDGSLMMVEISSHALPEREGKKYQLALANDITARLEAENMLREAKEKAEASDRLKTAFLNNISHEVRTPLNGIVGFAGIMMNEDMPREEKEQALQVLQSSSDRLIGTINNYMDISLIVSGNMEVNITTVNCRELLQDLFMQCRDRAEAKGLQARLLLPESLSDPVLKTDPDLLKKALGHLTDNAVKFTGEGEVVLGMRREEDQMVFFVRDTGPGIQKESLENIFAHFSQEDDSRTRKFEGSGLGLSIARGISGILGGVIEVDTEPGKGSEFRMVLPGEKNPPATAKETAAGIASERGEEPLKILVAEDDAASFFYLQKIMEKKMRAEMIYARNGQEAVEKFRENPGIALVLMDIKMPVMNGLEATRQIKSTDKNVPVLAITAYAMSGEEHMAREAGCDEYITKPVQVDLLLQKIQKYGYRFRK
ncbi:MAG TPA: hybrid sensor histidine kinase/response regulator [Bacteroidetes bacterium]|nr:hybrid sensor histidine kinase/response regulator [Bacteroidota bacterium]